MLSCSTFGFDVLFGVHYNSMHNKTTCFILPHTAQLSWGHSHAVRQCRLSDYEKGSNCELESVCGLKYAKRDVLLWAAIPLLSSPVSCGTEPGFVHSIKSRVYLSCVCECLSGSM